jgi:hypothetical protein
MLARLMRDAGVERPGVVALAALVLFPGLSTLGLVYPGWTAVLLLTFALWLGWKRRLSLPLLLLICLGIVAVKIRFAPLCLGLGLAWLMDQKGRRIRILAITCAAVILFLAIDRFALGGRFIWIRYLNMDTARVLLLRSTDLGWIRWILLAPVGMLIDFEQGLLFRAPWALLVPYGCYLLWKRDRRLFLWLLLPAVLYLLSIVLWLPRTWHSAPTPVSRLIVPVVPLIAVAAAQSLRRGAGRSLLYLSLVLSAIHILFPGHRFNLADGTDSLLAMMGSSTGLDHTRLLPSILRPELMTPALWGGLLVVSQLLLFRRARWTVGPSLVLMLILGSLAASPSAVLEAEDLTGEQRFGGELFPRSADPAIRYFWMGNGERLLRLADPLARVELDPDRLLEEPSTELSITARSFRAEGQPPWGIVAVAESDTIAEVIFESSTHPLPRWVSTVRSRRRGGRGSEEIAPARTPGNVLDTTIVLSLSSPARIVLTVGRASSFTDGRLERAFPADSLEGIYLNRLEFR